SCMDSRVPAEAVFDQSIGDLFSIRVAGNVVNADNLGSLEYAVKVVGVKTIVVLGHTACGAVKGAIDDVKLGNLTELLAKIRPSGTADATAPSKDKASMEKGRERKLQRAMNDVPARSAAVKTALASGDPTLSRRRYSISTG